MPNVLSSRGQSSPKFIQALSKEILEYFHENLGEGLDLPNLAATYARQVRKAVPILLKEQYSFPPILAPDFDILHRYFFPSLQPENRVAEVREARKLINTFPHHILILPGTENEMTKHIGKVYRIEQKIELLGQNLEEQSTECALSDQASLLTDIKSDLSSLLLTNSPPFSGENILQWISVAFKAVSTGIAEVSRFLNDSRVVRYRDLETNLDVSEDRRDELIEELQTMYSALSSEEDRKKTSNIRNDAINMCATILFHERFGFEDRLDRQSSNEFFSPNHGLNILFTTTTGRVLKGAYDRFSSDTLLEHLGDRFEGEFRDLFEDDHPHVRPCRVATVLRYSEIRSKASSPWEAKLVARQISRDARAFGLILEQQEEQRDSQAATSEGADSLAVRSRIADTSKFLLPFLELQMYQPSILNLEHRSVTPRGLGVEASNRLMLHGVSMIVDSLNRKGLFYEEMPARTSSNTRIKIVNDNLTGTWVLRCERQPSKIQTIYWPSDLSLSSLVQKLKTLKFTGDVRCTANYACDLNEVIFWRDDSAPKPNSEKLGFIRKRFFSDIAILSEELLVGHLAGEKALSIRPEFITVSSRNVQISCWLPHARNGRQDTVGTFYERVGAELVTSFLGATHSDRQNRLLIDTCQNIIQKQLDLSK